MPSPNKDPFRADIEKHKKQFDEDCKKVGDRKSFEEVRNFYLSRKKGVITLLLESLAGLSLEHKPEAGRLVNGLKNHIEDGLAKLEESLQAETGPRLEFDLTLPGRIRYVGAPHPVRIFQKEIEKIFLSMGFTVEEGPEVETDYYNFEALNFPPEHPARDDWDTLYISDTLLLRTHTSPVQIRVMEKQRPPIRMINPGKVFRKETPDPTHLPMFHQVEGLVVDEGVTFSHLKGTLEHFLRCLFHEKIKIRFRPSFFPFTEPSAEVDIECVVCKAKDSGCRVCGGTGWKEILGAGMVDPQVFKNVNIDPERYSGWAFGMGIERTAMLAYQIPDMRTFYENDMRFVRQFRLK